MSTSTLAHGAGTAKGLEAAIVQALYKTVIVVGVLCWAVFYARENGNRKPKENRRFGSPVSLPQLLTLLFGIRVLTVLPVTSPFSTPGRDCISTEGKRGGGNVQTR